MRVHVKELIEASTIVDKQKRLFLSLPSVNNPS